jgi:Ca2+-binding RTX toxin-like protein
LAGKGQFGIRNVYDTIMGAAGSDTHYGGADVDIFDFESATAFNREDVIKDFSTADGDAIDIADMLDFDPISDLITDFVQITGNGTDRVLAVDADGGADNFVQIATIEGVTGLTDEAALVSNGNLIAA